MKEASIPTPPEIVQEINQAHRRSVKEIAASGFFGLSTLGFAVISFLEVPSSGPSTRALMLEGLTKLIGASGMLGNLVAANHFAEKSIESKETRDSLISHASEQGIPITRKALFKRGRAFQTA